MFSLQKWIASRFSARKKAAPPDMASQTPRRKIPRSPFLRAHSGAQDDRYMNLSIATRNWQLAWQITAAILAVSVAFNGYYMMSSKFVPYVIAVDKLGAVISVGTANRAHPMDDARVIREQMIRWVEYARLIVADSEAQKRFMHWVYARVQSESAAKRALDRFVYQRKPFATAAQRTIDAHVTLALPISKRSYQVEWTETLHLPNGDVIRTERWKGLLSYRIAPLSTDEAIRANGAGFFITQFSWSKVLD